METNFKYVTLAVAVLVSGFSSCGNDDDPDGSLSGGEPKSVFLKVAAGSPSTYADEPGMTGATVIDETLGADVYFLRGSTVTDHVPIVPVGSADSADPTDITVTVEDLKNGHTFLRVSGSAESVYIVVNKPAGVNLPEGGELSDIETVAMDITSFTAINSVTMKGSGAITPGTPAAASVAVAPAVARFEISAVEYDAAASNSAANPITSYELAGIFVNNHHKRMGLDFKPIAGQLYASADPSDYTAENFPAPTGDVFTDKTGATAYTPENGVWAYQFFPVDPANAADDQPMLVIKLSNVVQSGVQQFTDDQYISVNRFETTTPGEYITKFDANHIYKISSIRFSNRNLSAIPGTTLQDVTVTVTVASWTEVDINPDL